MTKPTGALVPASTPLSAEVQAELATMVAAGEELRAPPHRSQRKAHLSHDSVLEEQT